MVVQDGEASREERKRQAVRKQQLRCEADAKGAKSAPLPPSLPLSALLRGALDLYIVSDAADEVPSGECCDACVLFVRSIAIFILSSDS